MYYLLTVLHIFLSSWENLFLKTSREVLCLVIISFILLTFMFDEAEYYFKEKLDAGHS